MIDRRLQVLRLVAARGTVTGAAEALHYTPSAVSQQLRALSRDLGIELFVQDGRRIRLTPAARLLVESTESLFEHWEEVRARVLSSAETPTGTLRLCGFSTAAAALLPGAAAILAERHPQCRVQIAEADPDECFELLLTDAADVAVVVATGTQPADDDPRFEQRLLIEDPLEVLLPRTHRLADADGVRLSDLASEAWIMDRPGRPYHQLLQTACAGAGFSPVGAHFASEWQSGAALVSAGLGIALIPRLAPTPAGYRIARLPLRDEPPPVRHLRTGIRRGSREQPLIAAALSALSQVASVAARGPGEASGVSGAAGD